MSLRITTNTAALSAQRNLEATNSRLESTLQKLSSGSRINKASDDAAGLAISELFRAEIRSVSQAMRNAHDGMSLTRVFEGGAAEITNMMIRMRELAMQAASDTVGDRERSLINSEVHELSGEVERIANTTRYANQPLLNGEAPTLEFQVGTLNEADKDRILFEPSELNMTASSLGVDNIDISQKDSAQNALEAIDEGIKRVGDIRAKIGAVESRLASVISTQETFHENIQTANSRIRDTDLAVETATLARETIVRDAGVAMLTQANQTPSLALQLLRN